MSSSDPEVVAWRVLQAAEGGSSSLPFTDRPLRLRNTAPEECRAPGGGDDDIHAIFPVVGKEEEEEETVLQEEVVLVQTVPELSSAMPMEEAIQEEEEGKAKEDIVVPLPTVSTADVSTVSAVLEAEAENVTTIPSTEHPNENSAVLFPEEEPEKAAWNEENAAPRSSFQVLAADPAARQPLVHRYTTTADPPFSIDVVLLSTTTTVDATGTTTPSPLVPDAVARQRVTERCLRRITARATQDCLPVLLGHAVLDECQQAWYLQASQLAREESSATPVTVGIATTTNGDELYLPVTVTPAALLQRVQRGRSGRVTRALYDAASFVAVAEEEEEEPINPYLEPDLATLVEWIQSPKGGAKTWTTADVQAVWSRIAIPSFRSGTTEALFLAQLLIHAAPERSPLHSLPFLSSASGHPLSPVVALAEFLFPDNETDQPVTRLVLECSGNADDDDDVTAWDAAYFGRCPSMVRLELPEAIATTLRRHVQEQAAQQEAEWHARRQWEADRRQSLSAGYWPLPSWRVAAAARRTLPPVEEPDPDWVLAQRWAATADEGRRKTSRRTGDQAGIFYGNQSHLTLKQLMDALLRAVSARPVPTLATLWQAVPDDSSDPVKRTRTALGRLLYKRNQLSRWEVDTAVTDAVVGAQLSSAPRYTLPVKAEEADTRSEAAVSELVAYWRTLQQTELQLRRLVLAQLTEIPVAIVATAGDERIGSMESMDEVDFENPASMAWQTEGHPLLHQRIYRPRSVPSDVVDETTPCVWWVVTGFVPSVASTISQDMAAETPSIGRAREPTAVERRQRFRAVLDDPPGSASVLILTEAQVRAGRKAAELYARQGGGGSLEHPFASGARPEITLLPVGEAATPPLLGNVVGHDRSWDGQRIRHQILVLPQPVGGSSESFWTTLDVPTEGGGMTCSIHGETYTVQQFDFHASSKAYQECMSIVRFLQRHPKAGVFQEPVDPIALGIPDYPKIIQHPMDVSTVLKKLERGDYSHIPPTFMKTASSVTRMLNGPFRNDVERIFDNAMLFNPPQDWIHLAASVVKKAVIKKIEQASSAFVNESRSRKQSSIYVDYDSDVDMYVYESDYDDDKGFSRKRRKRPGTQHSNADRSNRSLPTSEDSSTRCIERGIRIQKLLSDAQGLRGPLSNLPIVSNAADFSLPSDWICRYKPATSESNTRTSVDHAVGSGIPPEVLRKSQADLEELLSMHRLGEENDQQGTRRSTRASEHSEIDRTKSAAAISSFEIEYMWTNMPRVADVVPPVNRSQVELLRERLHETYFAKLYHAWGKHLVQDITDEIDATSSISHYSSGLFPPYLGRVVPMIPLCQNNHEGDANYTLIQKWEIRESMVLPALRWIIRGLLHSEHLVQIADGSGNPLRESLLSQSENAVVLPNHVYFIDDTETPYDVLDVKEMTRRKKQRTTATTEDSEDEVELSEYEKARAERVARNTQRLQALGLA
jgi:Bromodomain